MKTAEELELDAAVAKVLDSKSRKKLIVAGPGAGKTTLFQRLLDLTPGTPDQRLVLTFINNLKADLDRSLGDKATVQTLHGYCQYALRQQPEIRQGLTADFICHPELAGLIKQDWRWIKGTTPPKFVDLMRNLSCSNEEEAFYLERGAYYDAVDFDDAVYRVVRQLTEQPGMVPVYELVLVDEFQDFNRMESEIINLLGGGSPIVIAGDDDQALYSKLRGASWEYIRAHHAGGEFEVFELPFCMRCPEVVVGAINDVIGRAKALAKLGGRIDKPFRYFAPVKGADSQANPHIDLVQTSVQSGRANYFGKYVERLIRAIPEADFEKAAEKFEPCVLVIGSKPYMPQVEAHLVQAGLIDARVKPDRDARREGLLLLHSNPQSNLAWRILLGHGDQEQARACVKVAAEQAVPLADVIPEEIKSALLKEVQILVAQIAAEPQPEEGDIVQTPTILLTSYEGSKGLSAQHVVLIGLHDGDLPSHPAAITDMEICKILVGLTRTKKKCTLIATRRFGIHIKPLSTFVAWIAQARFKRISVNAQYWQN